LAKYLAVRDFFYSILAITAWYLSCSFQKLEAIRDGGRDGDENVAYFSANQGDRDYDYQGDQSEKQGILGQVLAFFPPQFQIFQLSKYFFQHKSIPLASNKMVTVDVATVYSKLSRNHSSYQK
jgi:hypothetical protein